ncbi:hypothetical protein ONA91_17660 [Micromonospora sp. DR5-3]|uniref:hypothetical protein n=1 Tax=unclassified Micromonospora TaxID=2617518 RepID=UPI0011D4B0E6|nr:MULTISPECIES: hypothetical protein [unclassified Micromonospora]MCW3816274.1 hypothetical protein [Micromonospora sp. DR5-3]TYC23916.1 hypothetical protein FXF52_12825 [Micromonospora sp. MP36]
MRTRVGRTATSLLLAGLVTAGCGPTSGTAAPGGATPTAPSSGSGTAGPTPGPWPNPSAQPADRVLRTGIRIGDDELVLSPAASGRFIDIAWFDTRTGHYLPRMPEDENFRSAYGDTQALPFFEVRERPAPDGRLITYGFASTRVARATIAQPGYPTATLTLAPWGGGSGDTLFWTARAGRPLTADLPAGRRGVCTLYDQSGKVIARLVLAEPRYVPRDG